MCSWKHHVCWEQWHIFRVKTGADSRKHRIPGPVAPISVRRTQISRAAGFVVGGKSREGAFSKLAEDETAIESTKGVYKTGPLEGRNFPAGSLFSFFTGITGKVPATVQIDFLDRLKFLFAKKEGFVERHKKSHTAFKQATDVLLAEYSQKPLKQMDMQTYQKEVQLSISEINESINWQTVQSIMGLKSDQIEVLKAITSAISSKHLTAYALTELMPSNDGALNRDVYEFLLKNAGSRYIYSIPAIFAITTDTYIVYTSNIFAILGLRAMFFLINNMLYRFHYLKYVTQYCI